MFVSAIAAFAYPFELFLLVYAVLGPLHYLTEISWLHDRGYYTQRKYDYLFLAALAVVITFYGTGLSDLFEIACIGSLPKDGGMEVAFLAFLAFSSALVFVMFKGLTARWVLIVALGFAGYIFSDTPAYGLLFALFLPTLIHVF